MLIVHLPIYLPNNGNVFYHIRKRCLNKYKLHHLDATCQVQCMIAICIFYAVYALSLTMHANTMAVMMLDTPKPSS